MSRRDPLATVSATLRVLLDCDRVWLVEQCSGTGAVAAWRSERSVRAFAAGTVLQAPGPHPLLSCGGPPYVPGRLSDGRTREESSGTAVRAAQARFGRHQLALPLPPGPEGVARAWLLGRADRDFTETDLAVGSGVLPLVLELDGVAPARVPAAPIAPTASTAPIAPTAAGEPRLAWSRLSPRERQVVELLVAGHTARRMGSVLGISPRTVGKHLQNAYDKLGQHDRLVIAVEHGKLAGTRR